MNRRSQPSLLCLVTAALCLPLGGCLVVANSDTSYEGAGVAVSPATLAQIEPDKTTREWVISTLGKPTSTSKPSEDAEVLRYDCIKRVTNSAVVFLIFAANDKKESRQSILLEIRNGVVHRRWQTGWSDSG